jgi:hypothetical protein
VWLSINADIRKNVFYQGLLILRQMWFCGQRRESRIDHTLSGQQSIHEFSRKPGALFQSGPVLCLLDADFTQMRFRKLRLALIFMYLFPATL